MSSTLGASFVGAKSNYNGREVELQIWDTAGQERFRSMVPMYLRNSIACILVFDITDRQSFSNLSGWINEIERSDCQPVALFIMANKSDLESRRSVDLVEAKQFAQNHKAHYFETSALTGKGIETAMVHIADCVLRRVEQTGLDKQAIYLHSSNTHKHSFQKQENEEKSASCVDVRFFDFN
uniref:Ras family protein n=1 Tax=Ditylenchus dipsaci TaxID=166011 RepID=A0A915E2P7_9BILA